MTDNPRHLSKSNEHFTPPYIIEYARQVMGGIDLDPACDPKHTKHTGAKFSMDQDMNGFLQQWWGSVFLNPPGGKCDVDGVTCIKPSKEEPYQRVTDGKPPRSLLSSQKTWWRKLLDEYRVGRVKQAVFISFSIELLQTSQVRANRDDDYAAWPLDFPTCFPRNRLAYWREDPSLNDGTLSASSSPPHASMIVYLPERSQLEESYKKAGVDGARIKLFSTLFDGVGRVVIPRAA